MRLEMFAAAENLEFEKAARLRDELKKLEGMAGVDGAASAAANAAFDPYAGNGKRKASGMRGKTTAKAAAPKNGRRYKTR